MRKYLFISPHPDDAEIGCGGLMARLSRMGREIHIALFTGEGDSTMVHSQKLVTFQDRMREQEKALSILKVAHLFQLNIAPTSQFDTKSHSVGVGKMDAILKTHHYHAVFIPLPSHASDHLWVWQVMMAATRPTKVDLTSLYGYEQPTQDHGPQLGGMINPRVYVPLTDTDVRDKMAALECFSSQFNGRAHTLSGLEGVAQLARFRGLEIGHENAEMFTPMRLLTQPGNI